MTALFSSLQLVLLVVAAVSEAFLAYAVFRSNPRSASNRIFAILSIVTLLWLITNYFTNHLAPVAENVQIMLLINRFGIILAAPMSALFFLLAHTIPSENLRLTRNWFYAVLGGTGLMVLLNASPFAFTGMTIVGGGMHPNAGPGLIPFSIVSTIFSVLAIYFLIRVYYRSTGDEHHQIGYMLLGMLLMLALIIATILIPVVVYSNNQLLALTPIYTLIFLGMTAYAITKYQLFNIKVIVTQALTVTIWIVLFAKLFGAQSSGELVVDGFILAFMVVFGVLLVRSVRREVRQRELIQKQEEELEIANRQQEGLLHFISHEVKSYLTKNQAAFSAMTDGDFGELSPELSGMAQAALIDTRKGVATVIDILDASNLKSGTVTYDKKPFDVAAAVDTVFHDLVKTAKEKGIELSYTKPVTGAYTVAGDEDKFSHHVIRNLIDNSIKYTPTGSVKVELSRDDKRIRLTITDTGVGITPEDKAKLFTEGGRGKESLKVNVHSTGYGLYIAKQVVDAHGGKIWAESDGAGKGSRFIVELPIAA